MIATAYIAIMSLVTTTRPTANIAQKIAIRNVAALYRNIINSNAAAMFHNTIAKHAAAKFHNTTILAKLITSQSIVANVAAHISHATTTNMFASQLAIQIQQLLVQQGSSTKPSLICQTGGGILPV